MAERIKRVEPTDVLYMNKLGAATIKRNIRKRILGRDTTDINIPYLLSRFEPNKIAVLYPPETTYPKLVTYLETLIKELELRIMELTIEHRDLREDGDTPFRLFSDQDIEDAEREFEKIMREVGYRRADDRKEKGVKVGDPDVETKT